MLELHDTTFYKTLINLTQENTYFKNLTKPRFLDLTEQSIAYAFHPHKGHVNMTNSYWLETRIKPR